MDLDHTPGPDRNGERILSDEVAEAMTKEADERQASFNR